MKKIISILTTAVMLFGALPCISHAEEVAHTKAYTKPYLLSLNPAEEMNVCWLTDSNAEAYVEYGETEALGTKVIAEQYEIEGMRTSITQNGYDEIPENNPGLDVYQQIATLENLKPNTTYYYKAVTEEEETKIYNFKTAPVDGEDFKFALISDLQLKVESPATVKQIGQQKPDFIIYGGDTMNTPWKAGEWFALENCFVAEGEENRSWFEIMQQEDDGCELLQYTPIFPVPGNHEIDDQRIFSDRGFFAENKDNWSMAVYMQIFRPLYPEQEYGKGGTHWYSADWGELHISNISVLRYQVWDGFEAPGWLVFDDISEGSPQVEWLENDLAGTDAKYKWVNMHWHMLNRGADGHIPLSEPVIVGDEATYPYGDWAYDVLRPLYEKYGVNGVNFGHSHVYERYIINGVNYIEAASIGNNYRAEDDPYHPSGNMPVIEMNDYRSFMILTKDNSGVSAKGIMASGEDTGKVFDTFYVVKNSEATSPKLVVASDDGAVSVKIDDRAVEFTDAAPFIDENDRTQIPISVVAEAMGLKADYNEETKSVRIMGDGVDTKLVIGEKTMTAAGKSIEMDTAAKIVNERTYIPVRFIAEAYGYEVSYGE